MTLKSTSSSQTPEKLLPIFPEIEQEKPASEMSLWVKVVVVVFPLLPVTPIILELQ